MLDRLGPTPTVEDARGAIDLAVTFWNASVRASKRWEHPKVKELNELRKRMRAPHARRGDTAIFDLLTEHRRSHWLDPRLIESWTYELPPRGVAMASSSDRDPSFTSILDRETRYRRSR